MNKPNIKFCQYFIYNNNFDIINKFCNAYVRMDLSDDDYYYKCIGISSHEIAFNFRNNKNFEYTWNFMCPFYDNQYILLTFIYKNVLYVDYKNIFLVDIDEYDEVSISNSIIFLPNKDIKTWPNMQNIENIFSIEFVSNIICNTDEKKFNLSKDRLINKIKSFFLLLKL